MLDDFGSEFETTESKLDSTMKKMAKVLHMNNGEFDKFRLFLCIKLAEKTKKLNWFGI